MQRPQSKLHIVSFVIVFLAVIISAMLVVYRQQVIDTIRAWQFTPSSQVLEIRNSLALTSLGQLYFDSSQPVVESAEGFNQSCPQSEPNNPVVGCYSNQLIYIYDVRNDKLDGIEETTAAHELLHAAYERMNDTERAEIDAELKKVYTSVKTKELEARMAYYQVNEPGEESNELHSILGTEYTQLGTKLEAHYAKYFVDRKEVLAHYQNYQAVFTSATSKLDALAASINERTLKVNVNIKKYERDAASLSRDIRAYNQRSSDSQAEYNTLTSRQEELRERFRTLKSEIAAIDGLRQEYDTLRKEYEALSRSINSSLEPTPTLKG